MIDILEIRNTDRVLIGVIDDAKSIIWADEYYGAGSLEIYVALSDTYRQLLKEGYYITRQGAKSAAIIESLQYIDNPQDGIMIVATGRMLKSILDRRLAYNLSGHTIMPVKMSGNLATAVQTVISSQAGATAGAVRSMGIVIGSDGGITKTIITDNDENSSRQSSYKGLLEFTDGVLQEYECGARMRIDDTTHNMVYDLFEGKDRTIGNSSGNAPVIFSQDFENLLTAEYLHDTTAFKNFALIGGEGQGLDRFYATYAQDNSTGIDRREVFVDATNYPRKYMDGETEKTYTDTEYNAQLIGQAQTDLKELIITETFTGEIALEMSQYKYGVDFELGDKVTIQDTILGLYINTRIISVTEVQDDNGYIISVQYGN